MLLLLRFFRSSEVAIRVVSTRRESDGSLLRLQSSRKKRKFLFPNKELKSENKLFLELLENVLVVCKSDFFLSCKNAWLTFY